MPNNVKNYILIKYEKLRDNTEHILEMIKNKFNLTKKLPIYKNIKYYKKEKGELFNKKEVTLPVDYQIFCVNNLNKEQEAKLGYNLLMLKK